MKVFIHNRQKQRPPNIRKLKALARFFLDQAGRLPPGHSWSEVCVVLVDDAGIMLVNRVFLDQAHTTDVITFTLPPVPGGAGTCGEIYINLEKSLEEGVRRGGAASELALYLAHGCDHLTGANDRTAVQRRRMRRRELLWIRRAHRAGCMAGLWSQARLP